MEDAPCNPKMGPPYNLLSHRAKLRNSFCRHGRNPNAECAESREREASFQASPWGADTCRRRYIDAGIRKLRGGPDPGWYQAGPLEVEWDVDTARAAG